MRLGISLRLTLVFVTFAAVILAGMGVLAYLSARESLQAAAVAELMSTAIEKQAALDAWMADSKASLGNISQAAHLTQEVTDLVGTASRPGDPSLPPHMPQPVIEDLRNWVGPGLGFRELMVIELDSGQVIAATDPGDVGKFREDRPFFIFGKTGPYVQNPYYDLAFGGPTATASAPIVSADGRVLAVLAGHLDLAEMDEIVTRRTGLHHSDDTFLVNTAQLFVTQPRLLTDPSVLQRMITTDAVNRCLQQSSGSVSSLDYRGVPSLTVYRWLPGPQLCLITKIDEEEALAAERSLGIALLLASGFVLLIAAGMSYWLSRSITFPILRLTAGAQQVGKGYLDYRIGDDARDETGDLARAFNAMTASLSQSRAETDQRQRLLVALGEAAQAVQRSTTTEAVYQILTGEVARLGYVPLLSKVTPDGQKLTSPYAELDDDELRAVGDLLGRSPRDLVISPSPGAPLDVAIRQRRGIFIGSADAFVSETLPETARSLAGQLASLLRLQQAIVAPLVVDGQVQAVLAVAGVGLTEADVPAVMALASQAAIALANARLHQETLAWATELETRVQQRTGELRASEERYRALAEAAPDMVFVVDRQDRIQYLNQFAAKQLGLNAEDALGMLRDKVFPASMAGPQTRAIRQVLREGLPMFREDGVSLDGRTVWLSSWLVPMRDPEGQVTAVMGVSRDTTGRKRAEEKLKAFSVDLERSNKELEQFAYVASHDLQEPLRMVASYTQLLARRYQGRLDSDADEFIGYAVEGANRMQRMINDLLAFSRVGTRGEAFRLTDLSAVLDDVLNDLRITIQESGAVITHDAMPKVVGDRAQLGRLFQNLIGNAIKFRGSEAPRVHVSAERTADGWEFAVSDNGIGIDPQYFDRLFIIFQRLSGKRDIPGTGIGLAICKKIVERHHGRIWVTSEPGKGATFRFTIPAKGVGGSGPATE